MTLSIAKVDFHQMTVRTRMPFRYGIATMTELPHLFVSVTLKDSRVRGTAADHLPPKWFTKEPERPIAQEIEQMREVIGHAAELAEGLSGTDFFDFWSKLYSAQSAWARENRIPALLGNLGPSLIERALLDALARQSQLSLAEMIRRDQLGLRLHELDSDLPPGIERTLLSVDPPQRIVLRHTVGLGDPLTDDDIRPSDRVDDGLPQSLADAVKTDGLRHFKIKIQASEAAAEHFERTLACLEQEVLADQWRFSIDANESFHHPEQFREFWSDLIQRESVARNLPRLLFVEQPLHRDVSLVETASWGKWKDRPPLIIDESDDDLEAGKKALSLGYEGMSHKNCKGVVKGLLNRCRIGTRPSGDGRSAIMSGEDLSNIGPVALLQDLAVQAILGNASVERNGHHYFRGLAMLPHRLQQRVVEAHPDLYRWHAQGFAYLRIEDGCISTQSVLQAPFGYSFAFDPTLDL
jgi:L-alanine-DL-glutamate epimerase-like enolase superfamily enzyme